MESCVRYTDLPGTTRLFADYQYHFDRLAAFYPHAPHDAGTLRAVAATLDYPLERRLALVDALRPSHAGSPSLERLAQPGTVAVVTGQQVGLFSGPAYTIYKALTAVRVAHALTSLGMEAVPVFWLATEDHDFAEVDHVWVFNERHEPFRVTATADAGGRPVGSIELPSPPLEALRHGLRGLPFEDEIVALAEAAYAPGVTLGDGFRALLQSLLGPYGILFLDPLLPAVRRIAAPLLACAATSAPELLRMVTARNQELQAAGYHAQVHVEPSTSLFFLLEGGQRVSLKRNGDSYMARDRRFEGPDLAARAAELSPNALLRPVVQDYLLPTAAYIGGPAEIAYLGQSEVLYRELLGRMPVVLSRAGFTLLDARARKLMAGYGLSMQHFFHGQDALRVRMGQRLVPASLADRFQQATAAVAGVLAGLETDLALFDPTLRAALEKSRRKILYQLSKIERKTARETYRRNERSAADAAWLGNLIFPGGHLQERFYSILPFLAWHGRDLISRIYETVHLDCPDHQVLEI